MWQFEQACLGIADACNALGTPVVSGNVSLYNETEGKGIFPTPTIGMVGLVEDCSAHAKSGFGDAGDAISLLGDLGQGHLGGSEYLRAVHGRTQGMPPPLDLAREKAVQAAVRELVRAGVVRTAHDCSDGGLAVTLAEACFQKDLGAQVSLEGALAGKPAQRADATLFGEDASRIIVACAPADWSKVAQVCAKHGVPCTKLGQVEGARLVIKGAGGAVLVDASVAELRAPWSSALPRLAGEELHAALEGVH
jgi:phosphoribosylformylglycinamidine synthase